MYHKPLDLKNLSLSFPHKSCFEDFSFQIHSGNFVAIIGRNGSGKSSLLKMILEKAKQQNLSTGYVEQIPGFDSLSGAERFHKALTEAIAKSPDILLLDEPTNHLDIENRKNLLYMLGSFLGSIIVISHDKELLRKADIIWHIDNGKVRIFQGNYSDYIAQRDIDLKKIEAELSQLNKEKRDNHKALMKEQKRASNSKNIGKKNIDNSRWPTICNKAKADRAASTTGKKKAVLSDKREALTERLAKIDITEEIKPKFHIEPGRISDKNLLTIAMGSIGYDKMIIENINLTLNGKEKLAIIGKNASGKSTLLKAIMSDPIVKRSGEWQMPQPENIGYLDQHYNIIQKATSPFELIRDARQEWADSEIRSHLNYFLFRKNEEVYNDIENLSGGERARLSLAYIAANPPKLLILDEITNNLDLATKDHITQILKSYPGAMMVVSHDENFLIDVDIKKILQL